MFLRQKQKEDIIYIYILATEHLLKNVLFPTAHKGSTGLKSSQKVEAVQEVCSGGSSVCDFAFAL